MRITLVSTEVLFFILPRMWLHSDLNSHFPQSQVIYRIENEKCWEMHLSLKETLTLHFLQHHIIFFFYTFTLN